MRLRSVTFGVVLAAATVPASAQIVTREIIGQPVETTITRHPDRIVVTRRALPPAGLVGIEAGVAPAYASYGRVGMQTYTTPPVPAETVGAPATATPDIGVHSVRTITVRPPASPVAAPQPASASQPAAAPARSAVGRRTGRAHARGPAGARRVSTAHRVRAIAQTRPAVALRGHAPARRAATTRSARRGLAMRTVAASGAGQSLVLTPGQRQTIYQSVVEQQAVPAPGTSHVTTAPVATTVVPPSAMTGYAVTYPSPPAATMAQSTAYASAGYPVTYTVGSVLPAGVPRAVLPPTIVQRVPQTQAYQYAVVNNRVLLVDPSTGAVVADVTE